MHSLNDADSFNNNPLTSPLLPKPGECGNMLSNRIYGGNKTKIDEYPWMALLEYYKGTVTNFPFTFPLLKQEFRKIQNEEAIYLVNLSK